MTKLLNLSSAPRTTSPARVEAIRESFGPVLQAIAPQGWEMVPLDPDTRHYADVYTRFTNPTTGAAMHLVVNTDNRPGNVITIAPDGWEGNGRVWFRSNHGFMATEPRSVIRALAVTEALGDRVDIVGWSSTRTPHVYVYGYSMKASAELVTIRV